MKVSLVTLSEAGFVQSRTTTSEMVKSSVRLARSTASEGHSFGGGFANVGLDVVRNDGHIAEVQGCV
eukprot:2861842-Amphidinium_carterae.1